MPDLTGHFAELERKYQARLGVYVPASGATAAIAYRADERFAFCSTFKAPLVAAVLHQFPLTHLDKVITYASNDIRSTSPITQQHVDTGMTVGQLCEAAIRYSDGTAANLLLADIGGTAAFTSYLRGLGDQASRLDQEEPELNRNPPEDHRDTTTPRAIALVFQQLALGDALPPDKRAMLTDWLARSTTGAKRIRAGFPADWKVIDKTGTGDYGRANDVAVVWSPGGGRPGGGHHVRSGDRRLRRTTQRSADRRSGNAHRRGARLSVRAAMGAARTLPRVWGDHRRGKLDVSRGGGNRRSLR